MANGMLSAMLEKLRSAASSDGQQCQILQQVNSIEVHRDPGAGIAAISQENLIILCWKGSML